MDAYILSMSGLRIGFIIAFVARFVRAKATRYYIGVDGALPGECLFQDSRSVQVMVEKLQSGLYTTSTER
jgi:hypothetical protein